MPMALPSQTATPTATPLPTFTPLPTQAAAGLYVDLSAPAGGISPLVYGSNYGPLLFVPLQMRPFVEDARLTVLRYPGGNWGEGSDMDEWNLDQFIATARQFGAEANIHVRLRGGTAEQAAEWVRLLNIEKGYNIRFWTIGNEPNLVGEEYPVEQFNREWRQWAEAMRAVDPTILLIGPETNQFFANPGNTYEQSFTDWVIEFLKVNGDLVDIVSFHRYPFPKSAHSGPPTPEKLLANSEEWDALIPAMRALVRQYAGRDLPIAVTEANSNWMGGNNGETTPDSHANAIWWGDSLGRMIRQGTYMVNQFAIIGDWGLMDNYEPYPIYYVYMMYKHFGVERLQAASDLPDVSIFAARRTDGIPTVLVVNRASQARTATLTLAHGETPNRAETWLFDREHAAVSMPPVQLDTVNRLEFPPQSMTLFVLCNCGIHP